ELLQRNAKDCSPPLDAMIVAQIAKAAPVVGPEHDDDRDQSVLIIELASQYQAEFFHTNDGMAYVTFTAAGVTHTFAIKERGYREWVSHEFFKRHGRPPGVGALADALNVLSGRAQHEGPERQVDLRIGGDLRV